MVQDKVARFLWLTVYVSMPVSIQLHCLMDEEEAHCCWSACVLCLQCEDGSNVDMWWRLQDIVLCASSGTDSVLVVWFSSSVDWCRHHVPGLLLRCFPGHPSTIPRSQLCWHSCCKLIMCVLSCLWLPVTLTVFMWFILLCLIVMFAFSTLIALIGLQKQPPACTDSVAVRWKTTEYKFVCIYVYVAWLYHTS